MQWSLLAEWISTCTNTYSKALRRFSTYSQHFLCKQMHFHLNPFQSRCHCLIFFNKNFQRIHALYHHYFQQIFFFIWLVFVKLLQLKMLNWTGILKPINLTTFLLCISISVLEFHVFKIYCLILGKIWFGKTRCVLSIYFLLSRRKKSALTLKKKCEWNSRVS